MTRLDEFYRELSASSDETTAEMSASLFPERVRSKVESRPWRSLLNGRSLGGRRFPRSSCERPWPLVSSIVLTEFRGRIARLLALCVFVLTFGRVQVNSTGRSTTDGPGSADTHASAQSTP